MMNTSRTRLLAAITLAAAMTFGLAGCGNSTATGARKAPDNGTAVTNSPNVSNAPIATQAPSPDATVTDEDVAQLDQQLNDVESSIGSAESLSDANED